MSVMGRFRRLCSSTRRSPVDLAYWVKSSYFWTQPPARRGGRNSELDGLSIPSKLKLGRLLRQLGLDKDRLGPWCVRHRQHTVCRTYQLAHGSLGDQAVDASAYLRPRVVEPCVH